MTLSIVAKHRLNTFPKRRVPNVADSSIRVNNEVLMFRKKPVGKWADAYLVQRLLTENKLLELFTVKK